MLEFKKEEHSYLLDGNRCPSVTEIIADAGLYGDAMGYFTDYARDRGSFVHIAIKYHIEGTLDDSTIDPVILPYLNAWKKFETDTGFISEITEGPMANESLMFAGTPDHIGKFNGFMTCIDVKTGITVFPAEQIQLAAYEILYGKPLKRFSLHLSDVGKYKLIEHKDRQDRQIFLSCLSIYQWKKNHLKRKE